MTTPPATELTMTEELLLLGLHPERSRFRVQRRYLRYGLAAAVLAELEGYGSVAEERGRIVVPRPVPTGRPLLDQFLDDLTAGSLGSAGKGKGEHLQRWLRRNGERAERLAVDALVARGAIRLDERRALGLFPYRRYPVRDHRLHGQVLASFHAALKRGVPDRRSRVLVGLALATDVATRLGVPWRVRRELKPLVREQWYAQAVHKQVNSDKAASNGG
ncbi:GOLPH3/VPS74 family protein [Streptomyces ochraceiscleroticus]|uniref:GPP34 family phosphoprotein n=1 Tax=Streptomyces ochraceiscleroticus TaxID=47761 RepID=A0ABW1MKW6_9ACTN|nr:GPP34 family phosphoprotein [Streptomyces ochraceiscleroticus]